MRGWEEGTNDGDDVGYSISRIDDSTGESSIGDLGATPTGGEGEDGLYGDVETLNVKRLEHDFCRILSILRWIQRRLRLNSPSVSCSATEGMGGTDE